MKLEEKIKRKLISCVNYAQYSMNDNLHNMITSHHYTLNSDFINELLVECIRLKFYESVNMILKISLEFNIQINWLTLCVKMLEGSKNLREPFYLSHISSDYQSQKLIFQTALENHKLNFHVYSKMFIISLIHLDATLVEFFLADKLFINEILNQPRYKINHFCAKKLIIEYAIKQSNYVLFVKFFNNSSVEWLKSNAFHFLYLSVKYKQFNCSTNILSLIDVNALFENNFSSLVKLIEISKDDIFFLNNDERVCHLIHKNIYSMLIESLNLNASHSLKFFFENYLYDIDRLTQSQKAYIINKSFKINKFVFLTYILTNNSYFFISSFKEWILNALMLLDYHKREESFLIKKSHISKQTFILKLFSNHEVMDQLDILLSNDPSFFCAINNDNLFFEYLIQKASAIYMQSRKKSPSRLTFI